MPDDQQRRSSDDPPVMLRALLPAGEPLSPAQLVEQLGLWRRPAGGGERPRVLLNMVSTADGRATVNGRSGPLSGRADRTLFHALRAPADGVLMGAGTVRMERYGRLVASESTRALRREHGFHEEPLACIVSGRLALEPDIPLLAQEDARVVLVTASQAALPGVRADVEYVRTERDGIVDLGAALRELRARFEVDLLLCEGGPHLASELLEQQLLDELFLSLAPALTGGEASGGEALRILAGSEFDPPRKLELLDVHEGESQLFLHYSVRRS